MVSFLNDNGCNFIHVLFLLRNFYAPALSHPDTLSGGWGCAKPKAWRQTSLAHPFGQKTALQARIVTEEFSGESKRRCSHPKVVLCGEGAGAAGFKLHHACCGRVAHCVAAVSWAFVYPSVKGRFFSTFHIGARFSTVTVCYPKGMLFWGACAGSSVATK